jgi:uncharacterized membrane protein (UPF0127 family)
MEKRKVFIFLLFLLSFSLAVFLGWRFVKSREKNNQAVGPLAIINNQKIYLEIADQPEEARQGLSGRESLPENQGMLFVFSQPGNHSFWMKEMKFNLDFVFINGSQVIDLAENIPFPQSGESPQTVIANQPFDKVLEINQGMIQKLEIKIGDRVSFSL